MEINLNDDLTSSDIDDILNDWKYACGEEKTSEAGTTFIVIPIADRRGNFLNLIQTLVDRGLSKEDVKSAPLSTKVAKICWSDLIKKMTQAEVKRSRDISKNQWEEAIIEFFAKPISIHVKERPIKIPKEVTKDPKKELTKEELLEEIFNPKDRLVSPKKIDRSNDTNWELYKELGIEPDGSENE